MSRAVRTAGVLGIGVVIGVTGTCATLASAGWAQSMFLVVLGTCLVAVGIIGGVVAAALFLPLAGWRRPSGNDWPVEPPAGRATSTPVGVPGVPPARLETTRDIPIPPRIAESVAARRGMPR